MALRLAQGKEAPQGAERAAWEPRIVALVCNWCSYAGADGAGTARRTHAPNVRIVRFLCTGRLDPLFIVKAFEQGADGVVVSGCHPGDCHYVQGNLVARRRFTALRALLDFLGLDLRRIHFAWVSAAEGQKWAVEVKWRNKRVGPKELERLFQRARAQSAQAWCVSKAGFSGEALTYARRHKMLLSDAEAIEALAALVKA